MAALIRHANSGYELANKPKIKTKEKENKREKTRERKQNNDNNNKQTLSEKKEEAGTVSEQRDKGWIHVIRVHDTINPLSSDNNTAGQQTLTRLPPSLVHRK